MLDHFNGKKFVSVSLIVFTLIGIIFGVRSTQIGSASASGIKGIKSGDVGTESEAQNLGNLAYLPMITSWYPWESPFGVESERLLLPGSKILDQVSALNGQWVRLNDRISWRSLQPFESDAIQWGLLTDFDNELVALNTAGITPVVVVDDYPRWATDDSVRDDGQPTSCGALLSNKVPAFADFIKSVVARYKTPQYNVHNWELGNEPDVDPNLIPPDNVYGCWGDVNDPYYGGERYGEMVKAVGAAIKAEDPTAMVWIGGLLLDSPNTTNGSLGKPELFLQGILESGAAPFFDIVPYHWYPPYLNQIIDPDNQLPGNQWNSWGGGVLGKANYLRQLMTEYGVSKPLFLNETAVMCPPKIGGVDVDWCDPPGVDFFQMQADSLVRMFVRGMSVNLIGFIWYTINGPGWRNVGLLDQDGNPRPAYYAFQQLNQRIQNSHYIGSRHYDDKAEAYAFDNGSQEIIVTWAKQDEVVNILFAGSSIDQAYDRDGNIITPVNNSIEVGFSPVYVILNP
jgi:hypothetical protein